MAKMGKIGTLITASVIGLAASFWLGYEAGNRKGEDYGVATANLICENLAHNHGCGQYRFEGSEAKFVWKNCDE